MPIPKPTKKRQFKDGNTPETGTLAFGSYFDEEFDQLYENDNALENNKVNRAGDTISGNLTIQGNLTVQGSTVEINTEELRVKDKVVTLNQGEPGAGVGGDGQSGVEVDRGSLSKAKILFDENGDVWKAGIEGSLHPIITNAPGELNAMTAKATPVDADIVMLEDSAASWAKKKLTWANIKAVLKTYFDSLYAVASHALSTHSDVDGWSNTNPLVNGTVSQGSANRPSRQDHVHPTDTSRAASSHPLSTHSDVDGWSNANPLVNGTVSQGSANRPSRQDHVHPTDTSRAADNAVVKLTGAQTVAGVKTFSDTLISSVKLPADGAFIGSPNTGSQNTAGRVVQNLVSYRNSNASVIGGLVFKSPAGIGAVMVQLTIKGYVHAVGRDIHTIVRFYWNGSTNFSYAEVRTLGGYQPQVRVGVKNTQLHIVLDDVGFTWQYPHIAITEALFSHTGVTDAVCTGWSVEIDNVLTGYTVALSEPSELSVSHLVTFSGDPPDLSSDPSSATSAVRRSYLESQLSTKLSKAAGNELSAMTAKASLADNDIAMIEDSAAIYVKKKVTWANIKAVLKTYFDTLYVSISSRQPIGSYYIQFANPTTNDFAVSEIPATLFGGTWAKYWGTEYTFFRTEGGVSNQSRSSGLMPDQMQQLTGWYSPQHDGINSEQGVSGVFKNLVVSNYSGGTSYSGRGVSSVQFDTATSISPTISRANGLFAEPRNRLVRIWRRES